MIVPLLLPGAQFTIHGQVDIHNKRELKSWYNTVSILSDYICHCADTMIPEPPSAGLLTAVFHTCDNHVANDYRGLVGTPFLAKLFAMMVNARPVEYTKNQWLRLHGQAGYQSNYQPTNVFIFSELMEHQRLVGCRLYACIGDFKKGFDTVLRLCRGR